jgi:SAM-dependent methyltransferase
MIRLVCNGRRLRILEPGCGSGIISSILAEFGEVTGIDQSLVGIRNAKQRVCGHFIVGRLPDICLNSEAKFDLCVLSQVLEHLHDEEQLRLLNNVYDYTKNEGYLIVTTPNKEISSRLIFKSGELQPIENWLDPSSLKCMLERTGWRLIKTIYSFNFFPVMMTKFPWLRLIRYILYDILCLRKYIENMTESWGIGDCIVVVAMKREV